MPTLAQTIDSQNMRGLLEALPQHVAAAVKLGRNVLLQGGITSVIICGMGGSAIGGSLLTDYFTHKLLPEMYPSPGLFQRKQTIAYTLKNVQCVRDYTLPHTVDEKTLVVVCSYSGNTEEAISCYREAQRKTKNILVLASGGKLKETAVRDRTPLIDLPTGLPPRSALPYLFLPVLNVLFMNKLIPNQEHNLEVLLKAPLNQDTTGSELAAKIKGKIPLIYASTLYANVAYRWKTECNENAKWPAFANVVPEMNHNEICSLTSDAMDRFVLIMFVADDDNKRIQKRMATIKDVLRSTAKKAGKEPVQMLDVRIKGDTYLSKVFSTVALGDWATYHLAILNSVDPTPVTIIEQFKKELGGFL